MPLDPQAQTLLDQLALQPGTPLRAQTPGEARALMESATRLLGPVPDVFRVEDRLIPGPSGSIRVRITAPGGTVPFAALVYFHGGGWVIGSIETHDGLCRAFTNEAAVVVVSVDYRLAPEHPYPAAVEDAYSALEWVAANAEALGVDPARIAVGGDSAGGNLAAVAALKARDAGGPALAFQLLIYPATDCNFDTPSYLANANGYMLAREEMIWFWDRYLPDHARRLEPYASPLRADNLSGLPPALVITAEYDPLLDEGEAFAARLEQAGVPVKLTRYRGMIHGFLRRHVWLDQGKVALSEVVGTLRDMAGTP